MKSYLEEVRTTLVTKTLPEYLNAIKSCATLSTLQHHSTILIQQLQSITQVSLPAQLQHLLNTFQLSFNARLSILDTKIQDTQQQKTPATSQLAQLISERNFILKSTIQSLAQAQSLLQETKPEQSINIQNPEVAIKINQDIFPKIRYSEMFLPQYMKVQDVQSPRDSDLQFDRHIVGVGTYEAEWFFLFNDGSKSETKTETSFNLFKQEQIPINSVIKRIRLQYENDRGFMTNLFKGLEFYDKSGKRLLRAGTIEMLKNKPWMSIREFEIEDNERLLGVLYGRRASIWARHYDLQFVIGSNKCQDTAEFQKNLKNND